MVGRYTVNVEGESPPLPSGVYYWWKNNVSINIGKVDMRQQQLEINGQEILTKDKAAAYPPLITQNA